MIDASPATVPMPDHAPLLQRIAAGDIFWVDQKNAEAQAILKFGHAYIAATLPMRPTMSPVMITLILTEEGRAASEKQREFFGDLDNAEKDRDAQAASKATHNSQQDAERIAFSAADEYVKSANSRPSRGEATRGPGATFASRPRVGGRRRSMP